MATLKHSRVLVTGADGFIGSHQVEQVAVAGNKVRALSQYNSFNNWGWLEEIGCLKEIEVVTGDIRDAHLIPTIVEQALDPRAPEIRLKDLRPRRDYVYVDDAIELLLSTLGENVKGIYNLGSGESASVAEIAELIRRAVGTEKPVVSDEQPRPQEVMDVRADISRAASALGWHPTTSLADGIAKVVAARRAQRE